MALDVDIKSISPKIKENLDTLKHTSSQPRSINADARIRAVTANLGEYEMFATLREIRWPTGIICPRCHSSNLIRKLPPEDESDAKWFYECLDCKDRNLPCLFNDLTEFIAGKSLYALKQLVSCFYLMKFCSISQIATALGVNPALITQLLDQVKELDDKAKEKLQQVTTYKETKKESYSQKQSKEYSEELLKRWKRPGGHDGLDRAGTANSGRTLVRNRLKNN